MIDVSQNQYTEREICRTNYIKNLAMERNFTDNSVKIAYKLFSSFISQMNVVFCFLSFELYQPEVRML